MKNQEKTNFINNQRDHFFLDVFTKSVCFELSQKIKELFQVQVSLYELAQAVSFPPEKESGHWALPCFFLGKKLKKKPDEVALHIARAYNKSSLWKQDQPSHSPVQQAGKKDFRKLHSQKSDSSVFEKAVQKGPYVNLFFKKNFLKKNLLDHLLTNKFFYPPTKKIGAYLVEYSQPNTHKELHIGHTRNLCFGLSLITVLKKRGFPVISCTYPGDMGTHVAKCLWYLKHHNTEPVPTYRKGQWLGAIYTKAYQKYAKEENTPQKEENKNQLTEILRQLQKKHGEYYNLWKQTRQWSKELMDEVYQWAGAQFDYWYWESDMDEPSIKWVKELLKQKKLQLSEGAIGLDLGESLGFCLLLKSDGNGLYATKDLYLARKKFEDHKISENIYIVDQRQSAHFQQIFKVLEKIGLTEEGQKSKHLKYNFVELKTGAMSSRAGNIVPIMTLIEKMTKYISDEFLQKYKKEWSEEKIKNTVNAIAQGAIKYGMNVQEVNKKIVFDMKEWLKLDGRSGPYIQYAHARACSLLKKLDTVEKNIEETSTKDFIKEDAEQNIKQDVTQDETQNIKQNIKEDVNQDVKHININYLNSLEEWQLILHLSWFSLTLEKAAWQMKTSTICYYLFELAQKFSRFYQNCPISTLDNKEQKQFRRFLVQVTRKTLEEGLSALSIPAPEQM